MLVKLDAKGLLAYYQENPDSTMKQAAEAFGVTPPTIQYHLDKLTRLGLVRRSRKWRSVEVIHPWPGDAVATK